MRLEDCQEWINTWALHEMYAGIPGKGATDAWYEALMLIEGHKLEQQPFFGGVADIAKFFDQLRRPLVYKVAEAAGNANRNA